MKKAIMVVAMALLACVCAAGQGVVSQEINAGWEFRQLNIGEWMPATVPGTVHTDLLAEGKIEDPYYRMNERDQQWIDKVAWEYQCTFDTPDSYDMKHLRIVLEGLDTYADVLLNDTHILVANNMFRQWEQEISGLLQPTGNRLHIVFSSPISYGLAGLTMAGIEFPAGNDQSEVGGLGPNKVSPYVRKAGYHFGWDWGPRFVTSGIWRPVRIEAWNDARFDKPYISTVKADRRAATMSADLNIIAYAGDIYTITIETGGKVVSRVERGLDEGKNKITESFTLKNPQLWYPNGMGEQNMYAFDITLSRDGKLIDKTTVKTGIRTVELIRERDADGEGESFMFEVNGRRVFCKGANYIPNDLFLPRFSPEQYEHIVRSAAEANMNMLRIWGGGTYENDIFYELCDRYGIMIWQDFMFSCTMYPDDEKMFASIEQEAQDNIVRLRNHPCIALWCGNNEIELAWAPWSGSIGGGWGWKRRYTEPQRESLWHAYDTVFHNILPQAVERLTRENNYWPSSPSPGYGIANKPLNRTGDMHYWDVWHGRKPFESYNDNIPRFMSEYGFQSFPEFATVKSFTLPEDWDINSPVMAAHQRSGIGNMVIKEYMERYYDRMPAKFENILYLSQILQAESMKCGIEAHRRNMPYCMGSLYWQLNDCWPVASWSGIDSYGRWKALHYFARTAFAPLLISPYMHDGVLEVYLVSDLAQSVHGTLTLSLMDFGGKELRGIKLKRVTASADSSVKIAEYNVSELLAGADPRNTMLKLTFDRADGRTTALHYFEAVKNLNLPTPTVTTEVRERSQGVYEITLSTDLLAKNVALYYEGVAGIFSDNYFDLLPGHPHTVTLHTAADLAHVRSALSHTDMAAIE
jgi:beta-mannosidase